MHKPTDLHYSAFISYRDVYPDNVVARHIHSRLEHYKLPKHENANGKLGKIFLYPKYNKGKTVWGSIEKALDTSEYLIVICSGRTFEDSSNVPYEIDYFISRLGEEEAKKKLIFISFEGRIRDGIPSKYLSLPMKALGAIETNEALRVIDIRYNVNATKDSEKKHISIKRFIKQSLKQFDQEKQYEVVALMSTHREEHLERYAFRQKMKTYAKLVSIVGVILLIFALNQYHSTQKLMALNLELIDQKKVAEKNELFAIQSANRLIDLYDNQLMDHIDTLRDQSGGKEELIKLTEPFLQSTESIDDMEKEEWHALFQDMTYDQVATFLTILATEGRKLSALEDALEVENAALDKNEILELERIEGSDVIHQKYLLQLMDDGSGTWRFELNRLQLWLIQQSIEAQKLNEVLEETLPDFVAERNLKEDDNQKLLCYYLIQVGKQLENASDQLDLFNKSIDLVNQSPNLNKDAYFKDYIAFLLSDVAEDAISNQLYDESNDITALIERFYPESVMPFWIKARTYDSKCLYEDAIINYQAAIEKYPYISTFYNNLSWTYLMTGDYQNAVKAGEAGAEKIQDMPEIYLNIGHGYLMLNQYDKAIEAYSVYLNSEGSETIAEKKQLLLEDIEALKEAGLQSPNLDRIEKELQNGFQN